MAMAAKPLTSTSVTTVRSDATVSAAAHGAVRSDAKVSAGAHGAVRSDARVSAAAHGAVRSDAKVSAGAHGPVRSRAKVSAAADSPVRSDARVSAGAHSRGSVPDSPVRSRAKLSAAAHGAVRSGARVSAGAHGAVRSDARVSVGADSTGVGLSLHGYSLDDIARLTDTAVRGCPGVSQGKAFADRQVAADAIVELLATTTDPPPAGWLVSAGRWAIRHNIATERRHHGRRRGQATTNFARYWAHPQPRSDPSFVEHIVEGVALAQVWQVLPAAHRAVLAALAAHGDRHAAAAALGMTLSLFEQRLTAARARFLGLWYDHETPRRRIFDDTARQHARRLRAQGHSVRRVAGKLGVTTKTIHEWTRGVRPEGSNGYRGPLPRQRAQARRMRAQGHTPTEIAVIVGVHPVTVRRWTADITVAS
jgi:hypothetical protein